MNGPKKEIYQTALGVLLVYTTTSVHHMYGAWLYQTPWRNHIAYQGFSWLLISYAILLVLFKWPKKFVAWAYVLFAGFFFVGAIGLYEGVYNHLFKNLLYFGGVAEDVLQRMYPPPKYELPNDWLFEITGILTVAVSYWCLLTMIRLMSALSSK